MLMTLNYMFVFPSGRGPAERKAQKSKSWSPVVDDLGPV